MVSPSKIIASRPKPARKTVSRRGVARAEALGRKDPRTYLKPVKPTPAPSQAAEKIIVSNLPTDVNEAQIKVCLFLTILLSRVLIRSLRQELFHSTIGPLKDVTLHYDPTGRSKGVANILFQRKGDGAKAYQQYNNRLIDGS